MIFANRFQNKLKPILKNNHIAPTKMVEYPTVLTFATYDDMVQDTHKVYTINNEEELCENLTNIWKKYKGGYLYNFTRFENVNDVFEELLEDGYYVWNRFEKYYAIVFVLGYKSLWVWSRSVDPQFVTLGYNENGEPPIVIDNLDPDYDVSPVVTLLKNSIQRE